MKQFALARILCFSLVICVVPQLIVGSMDQATANLMIASILVLYFVVDVVTVFFLDGYH